MPYITEIYSREVLDSRGLPTIETEVYTESGAYGRATVDTGIPFGRENEIRDKEKKYLGLSVSKAVENVNRVLAKGLIGEDVRDQVKIDKKMISIDASTGKTKLGANAILSLSVAILKAAASYSKLTLQRYLGGVSSSIIPSPTVSYLRISDSSKLIFSEILASSSSMNTYKDSIRILSEVSYTIKSVLEERQIPVSYSSNGAYFIAVEKEEDAFDIIKKASEKCGYKLGGDINLSIISNVSKYYDIEQKSYKIKEESKSSQEISEIYDSYYKKHGVVSISDPLNPSDTDGLKKLTKKLSGKMQLFGDNTFMSSLKTFDKLSKENVLNGIIVRPSIIGTITETVDLIDYAKRNGYYVCVQSDEGSTDDAYIANLAVGAQSRQIRFGGLNGTSNIGRYNELLRIEDDSRESYKYAQKNLR